MINKEAIKAGDWIAAEYHEHTKSSSQVATGRTYRIEGEVTPQNDRMPEGLLVIGPYSLNTEHLEILDHKPGPIDWVRDLLDCEADVPPQQVTPDWQSALVVRNERGYYYGKTLGGWQLLSWRAIDVKAPDDELGPVTVVIDADGRNVEADRRESLSDEVFSENHRTWEDLTNTLHEQLGTAEQSLAEAVRGRETALRDLRKAEQRAEKAEADRDRYATQCDEQECLAHGGWAEAARNAVKLSAANERIAELEAQRDLHDLANGGCVPADAYSAVSDSYNEVWTDLQRAGLAWKSARQRAWSWKGTAEALGDQLDRKIKKLKKQRDKARNANDVRAADELEDLALEISALDWDVPGVTVGRAVQNLIRGRAAKLRGEK